MPVRVLSGTAFPSVYAPYTTHVVKYRPRVKSGVLGNRNDVGVLSPYSLRGVESSCVPGVRFRPSIRPCW